MPDFTEFCPAKINPYLAVTGRRDDGFHELVSVVTQISVGDDLDVSSTESGFALTCDDPNLPTDGSNLVLKAAHAFREASGWGGGARFHLRKKVPSGAGLGGGSSDAVGALRALNRLSGQLLDAAALASVAAEVGSDCPLFLSDQAVVMRGRGEQVEPAPALTGILSGRELLLVRPGFGVNTAWAYQRLAAGAPESYRGAQQTESEIARWREADAGRDGLGFNSFWPVVASKYPALPAMARCLADQHGAGLHLSGSGSACFVWVNEAAPIEAIANTVREGWGPSAWIVRATCLPETKSD